VRLAWCAATLALIGGSWCAIGPGASGQEPVTSGRFPLHERIDALIDAAAIGPLAPLCSDADFVRRIYLDLTGVIPTAEQARAFVADKTADKRQRLIDELLASPAFNRHMAITLDAMLMERKPEKVIKQAEWEAYLYRSIADDKPVDKLFGELIVADGADSLLRPAAKFTLDRDAEPNSVTRDIGRLAFGMDMQCCQCHDHPLIDDYYQGDYYGLLAFVHRTSLFTDAKTRLVSLTEKADGEASFKSVFTGASSDKAQPRLPKGAVLFVEPTFAKDQEYIVKPDKTIRGVPKFSRRATLAEMLPTSREFSRNVANRLWAHMVGRGLVHPLDFHYTANPPSHPRLLTLLAEELESSRFHIRPLLRELALTRAYQRSCEAPRPETVNLADVAARLERLARDKETQQKSIAPLTEALAKAKANFKAARDEEARIAADVATQQKALADAKSALAKAAAAQVSAQEALSKLREKTASVNQAATNLTVVAATDDAISEASAKLTAVVEELNAAEAEAATTLTQKTGDHAAAHKQLADVEEQLALATAARPTTAHLRQFEGAQLAAEHQLADAKYTVAQIDSQIATAKAVLDHAALAKTDPTKADAAWSALVEHWTIAGQIAPLKPLTPEQFAASGMQATDILTAQTTAAYAKWAKSSGNTAISVPFFKLKLGEASETERAKLAATRAELDLMNQLRGPFNEFVRQYGGLSGQEFQATVNQALFFGNGTVIDGWLKPAGSNLVARVGKLDDAAAIADELSWSIFSRPATDSERQAAIAYLKDRTDKPTAIAEMTWALLSSTEFRFNH
jgi:hypothetical protein